MTALSYESVGWYPSSSDPDSSIQICEKISGIASSLLCVVDSTSSSSLSVSSHEIRQMCIDCPDLKREASSCTSLDCCYVRRAVARHREGLRLSCARSVGCGSLDVSKTAQLAQDLVIEYLEQGCPELKREASSCTSLDCGYVRRAVARVRDDLRPSCALSVGCGSLDVSKTAQDLVIEYLDQDCLELKREASSCTSLDCGYVRRAVARVRDDLRPSCALSVGCGSLDVSKTAQDLVIEYLDQDRCSSLNKGSAEIFPKKKIKLLNISTSSVAADNTNFYCVSRNSEESCCAYSNKYGISGDGTMPAISDIPQCSESKIGKIIPDNAGVHATDDGHTTQKPCPRTCGPEIEKLSLKSESIAPTPASTISKPMQPRRVHCKTRRRKCHPHLHSWASQSRTSAAESFGKALTSKLLQLLDSGARLAEYNSNNCKNCWCYKSDANNKQPRETASRPQVSDTHCAEIDLVLKNTTYQSTPESNNSDPDSGNKNSEANNCLNSKKSELKNLKQSRRNKARVLNSNDSYKEPLKFPDTTNMTPELQSPPAVGPKLDQATDQVAGPELGQAIEPVSKQAKGPELNQPAGPKSNQPAGPESDPASGSDIQSGKASNSSISRAKTNKKKAWSSEKEGANAEVYQIKSTPTALEKSTRSIGTEPEKSNVKQSDAIRAGPTKYKISEIKLQLIGCSESSVAVFYIHTKIPDEGLQGDGLKSVEAILEISGEGFQGNSSKMDDAKPQISGQKIQENASKVVDAKPQNSHDASNVAPTKELESDGFGLPLQITQTSKVANKKGSEESIKSKEDKIKHKNGTHSKPKEEPPRREEKKSSYQGESIATDHKAGYLSGEFPPAKQCCCDAGTCKSNRAGNRNQTTPVKTGSRHCCHPQDSGMNNAEKKNSKLKEPADTFKRDIEHESALRSCCPCPQTKSIKTHKESNGLDSSSKTSDESSDGSMGSTNSKQSKLCHKQSERSKENEESREDEENIIVKLTKYAKRKAQLVSSFWSHVIRSCCRTRKLTVQDKHKAADYEVEEHNVHADSEYETKRRSCAYPCLCISENFDGSDMEPPGSQTAPAQPASPADTEFKKGPASCESTEYANKYNIKQVQAKRYPVETKDSPFAWNGIGLPVTPRDSAYNSEYSINNSKTKVEVQKKNTKPPTAADFPCGDICLRQPTPCGRASSSEISKRSSKSKSAEQAKPENLPKQAKQRKVADFPCGNICLQKLNPCGSSSTSTTESSGQTAVQPAKYAIQPKSAKQEKLRKQKRTPCGSTSNSATSKSSSDTKAAEPATSAKPPKAFDFPCGNICLQKRTPCGSATNSRSSSGSATIAAKPEKAVKQPKSVKQENLDKKKLVPCGSTFNSVISKCSSETKTAEPATFSKRPKACDFPCGNICLHKRSSSSTISKNSSESKATKPEEQPAKKDVKTARFGLQKMKAKKNPSCSEISKSDSIAAKPATSKQPPKSAKQTKRGAKPCTCGKLSNLAKPPKSPNANKRVKSPFVCLPTKSPKAEKRSKSPCTCPPTITPCSSALRLAKTAKPLILPTTEKKTQSLCLCPPTVSSCGGALGLGKIVQPPTPKQAKQSKIADFPCGNICLEKLIPCGSSSTSTKSKSSDKTAALPAKHVSSPTSAKQEKLNKQKLTPRGSTSSSATSKSSCETRSAEPATSTKLPKASDFPCGNICLQKLTPCGSVTRSSKTARPSKQTKSPKSSDLSSENISLKKVSNSSKKPAKAVKQPNSVKQEKLDKKKLLPCGNTSNSVVSICSSETKAAEPATIGKRPKASDFPCGNICLQKLSSSSAILKSSSETKAAEPEEESAKAALIGIQKMKAKKNPSRSEISKSDSIAAKPATCKQPPKSVKLSKPCASCKCVELAKLTKPPKASDFQQQQQQQRCNSNSSSLLISNSNKLTKTRKTLDNCIQQLTTRCRAYCSGICCGKPLKSAKKSKPCAKPCKCVELLKLAKSPNVNKSAKSSLVSLPTKSPKAEKRSKSSCTCPPTITPCSSAPSLPKTAQPRILPKTKKKTKSLCLCPPTISSCGAALGLEKIAKPPKSLKAVKGHCGSELGATAQPPRLKSRVKLINPDCYKGNQDGVISVAEYEKNKKKKKKTKAMSTDMSFPICTEDNTNKKQLVLKSVKSVVPCECPATGTTRKLVPCGPGTGTQPASETCATDEDSPKEGLKLEVRKKKHPCC